MDSTTGKTDYGDDGAAVLVIGVTATAGRRLRCDGATGGKDALDELTRSERVVRNIFPALGKIGGGGGGSRTSTRETDIDVHR